MLVLTILDILFVIFSGILIIYQLLFTIVGTFCKPVVFPDAKPKKYAVVTSARNEANVIENFIENIKKQDYDQKFLDVWVIADNCDDNTAEIARKNGAKVIERFDKERIGKGFALTFFFDKLIETNELEKYEGFCILDTDNILKKNYMTEMNKAFSAGYSIVTSYRNSTNLSKNWLSASAALWFIRESKLVNNSRQIMGLTCHVGGTGFLFSKDVIKRKRGWAYHLITEDLEFTIDSILYGYKIGYCGSAILYDEQPTGFRQFCRQRLRWARGFLEVFLRYTPRFLNKSIKNHSFAGIDILLMVFPWSFIIVLRVSLGFLYAHMGFVSWIGEITTACSLLLSTVTAIFGVVIFSIISVIIDRKNVNATNKQIFGYCLLYPIFLLAYIPISFVAVFKKVNWKPIYHSGEVTFNQDEVELTDN